MEECSSGRGPSGPAARAQTPEPGATAPSLPTLQWRLCRLADLRPLTSSPHRKASVRTARLKRPTRVRARAGTFPGPSVRHPAPSGPSRDPETSVKAEQVRVLCALRAPRLGKVAAGRAGRRRGRPGGGGRSGLRRAGPGQVGRALTRRMRPPERRKQTRGEATGPSPTRAPQGPPARPHGPASARLASARGWAARAPRARP